VSVFSEEPDYRGGTEGASLRIGDGKAVKKYIEGGWGDECMMITDAKNRSILLNGLIFFVP
jgi:hypothetical protein